MNLKRYDIDTAVGGNTHTGTCSRGEGTISSHGTIVFDPENKTKKHEAQSSWKTTVMVNLKDDAWRYYCWFVNKRFNLVLNKPLRETHVTIVNDRDVNPELYCEVRNRMNGKTLNFEYNPDVRTNGLHWWLPVESTEAEDLREQLGLSRKPYFNFHLTIGYANERNIEHSRYVHHCIVTRGDNYK